MGIVFDYILNRLRANNLGNIVGGDGISVEQLVFRESFTGNGSDTTFQLTGVLGNSSFAVGEWKASSVKIALPSSVTKTNKQPVYDSVILFVRNRVSIVSISATGLVTLSHAPRSGADFYVWYWYDLEPLDKLNDYFREDFVAFMEADLTDLEAKKVDKVVGGVSGNVAALNAIGNIVDSGRAASLLDQSTELARGTSELATQAETDLGADDLRIITSLKLKNKRGVEAFFLNPQGVFGTGGGWADSGFIADTPVLLFAQNLTERAIYMFYALARTLYDSVNPDMAFLIYSTSAPSGGSEDVRWQLEARYIAEGESPTKAADEILLITQSLSDFTANQRQAVLIFTLDRSLIADQDVLMFTLSRIGGDGADTYGSDAGVGQAGIIIETTQHNP